MPIFEPHYDPCICGKKNPSTCRLARGLEGLFVTDIVHRLYRRLSKRKRDWSFHECIYMPSPRIEGECGFDVSFGHFEEPSMHRVRLMHKLVPAWCDDAWKWSSNSEVDRKGVYRCADHIFKLATQFWKSDGKIVPYLSFSVCFCLHEHRRMGRDGIPSFEDDRRSVFVELRPLSSILGSEFDSKAPGGELLVRHRVENHESPISACWRSREGKQTKLRVLGLQAFLNAAEGFLTPVAESRIN
jgi:hypothetical protein